jgi:hypothetical protein
MTPSDEDALLSDLAEADRHMRESYSESPWQPQDMAYVARLLRHALEIVESQHDAAKQTARSDA